MKLNEKIYHYRKRAKLSQEELAAQVGVSRQAVSKWELGEATPELEKLLALAKAFGVTTDELLSESEPEPQESDPEETAAAPSTSGQLDHTVGRIGRLIRRYGWLAGVYIALSGLGGTVIGALARYMFGRAVRPVNGADIFDSAGFPNPSEIVTPPMAFATVILVIGVCIMIAGIVLAVVLYRKGRKNS